jgi:hypothetical protein
LDEKEKKEEERDSRKEVGHPLCGWAGDRFFARLQVSCKSLMVDYFK